MHAQGEPLPFWGEAWVYALLHEGRDKFAGGGMPVTVVVKEAGMDVTEDRAMDAAMMACRIHRAVCPKDVLGLMMMSVALEPDTNLPLPGSAEYYIVQFEDLVEFLREKPGNQFFVPFAGDLFANTGSTLVQKEFLGKNKDFRTQWNFIDQSILSVRKTPWYTRVLEKIEGTYHTNFAALTVEWWRHAQHMKLKYLADPFPVRENWSAVTRCVDDPVVTAPHSGWLIDTTGGGLTRSQWENQCRGRSDGLTELCPYSVICPGGILQSPVAAVGLDYDNLPRHGPWYDSSTDVWVPARGGGVALVVNSDAVQKNYR